MQYAWHSVTDTAFDRISLNFDFRGGRFANQGSSHYIDADIGTASDKDLSILYLE